MVGQISFSSSNPTLGQLSKTGYEIGSVSIGQFSNFLFCLSDVFVLFRPIVCRYVVISGESRFVVSSAPESDSNEKICFSRLQLLRAAVEQRKAPFPLNFFCWSSSDQGFSTVFSHSLKSSHPALRTLGKKPWVTKRVLLFFRLFNVDLTHLSVSC